MVVSDLLVLSGPRWCFDIVSQRSNTQRPGLSLFWWNGNLCSALREDEVQQSQTALGSSVALRFIKCIHVFTDENHLWKIQCLSESTLLLHCISFQLSSSSGVECLDSGFSFIECRVWLALRVYCAKTSLGSFELMRLWCSKILLSYGAIECRALKIRLMSNARPLST